MKDIFDVLARICIASMFLITAITKIFNLPDPLQYFGAGIETYSRFFSILGMILMVLGGLLVLLGYRSTLGATLLILYLVPSSIIYHWDLQGMEKELVLMKDIAILGGLLMILAHGSGKYSIRRILASTRS